MTRPATDRPHRRASVGLIALPWLLLAAAPAGAAQPAFVDPPVLQPTAPGETPRFDLVVPGVRTVEPQARLLTTKPSPAAPGVPSPGRRTFDLHVRFIRSRIDDPREGKGVSDEVNLRGYAGAASDPKAPYVAPVIEVAPGQRVTVNLHNDLPADPSCTAHGDMDQPHCFNGTNLHSHGLWVSPAGNGDNVLLSINPQTSFTYYYDLPDDHPAGTFWYHSHRHGSTALQVSSGMAGALIVRGDRLPTPAANGDIDTLLKRPDGTRIPEHTLVFQQIQYACLDAAGNPKTGPDGYWICDKGDVGEIRDYKLFGPDIWAKSGRYTTINGLVHPRFTAQAGTVERWRMIHGGVRDTITVAFRPLRADAPRAEDLSPADAARYIAQYCPGDPIRYHVVAADGLTMAAAQEVRTATFQPGYRWDALVVFPQAGEYCVTDEPEPRAGSVSQQDKGIALLATVTVAGGRAAPDPHAALTDALVAAADRTMPADVKGSVQADLRNGLKLTRFVPHPTIADREVDGTQEMTFLIDVTGKSTKFEVADQSIVVGRWPDRKVNLAAFKPAPYDPTVINRVRPLNGVDEWTLQSAFVSHPFHIHVNPFQIVEILDPSGRDVSAVGSKDGDDPQYAGLKGLWKDTLWVKNDGTGFPNPENLLQNVYTIRIRTRYERFVGEYVLHCHILDHEDQGMMQNVCIDLPGSVGVCGGQTRPPADAGGMTMHD